MSKNTLGEHVKIARTILQEDYGCSDAHLSYEVATEGMGALRALARFILALHPESASGNDDEHIESLIKAINGEVAT